MVVLARRRPRAAAAAAVLVLAVVALAVVAAQRPVRGAVPAGTQVGTVTYTGLVSAPVTEAIRSFSTQVSVPPPTANTGGSTGKASFGNPTVVQGADRLSPAVLAAAASGKHLPTVTVDLTHPSGTPDGTRTTRWTYTDVVLVLDRHVAGTPSASPAQTVSWSFVRVKQEALSSTGAVLSAACYNAATNSAC